jgi:hypothetical protein
MRQLLILLLLIFTFNFGYSQEKPANTNNETVGNISFICDSSLKYVMIQKNQNKDYLIYIMDGKKKDTLSDILTFEIDYTDDIVSTWITKSKNSLVCVEERKSIIKQLRDKINKHIQTNISSEEMEKLKDALSEFEKETIAGTLKSLGKEIPVYNYDETKDTKRPKENPAYKHIQILKDTVYIVDTITVKTDYNRISLLQVEGHLKYYDTAKKDFVIADCDIVNNQYSISFPGLNDKQYIVKLNILSFHSLWINFGEILKYSPFNGSFSYMAANQEVKILPNGSKNVIKRKLSDYLSFRTFLDPLGFLGTNPNGFAQLEGDAILPLKYRGTKSRNWFPQATFNFNYIYNNSINSEPRIAPAYTFRNMTPLSEITTHLTDSNSRFVNNIDLVKYSYYQFNAKFSLYAHELKSFSSWLHFEGGIRVLGAKVDTTIGRGRTLHKLIPEVRLRLEIRPANIIGASVSVGLAWLGNSHQGSNSPLNINDISFLYKSIYAIPHEVSIYASAGNNKGGLFFRYVGWLAYNQKLSESIDATKFPATAQFKKTSYFPQILIGYSTNLSVLINKISKAQ